jgi:3-deoxy-manno-octulosonate cytidylyltransferase (CMP-KDO synthetase)
VVVLTDDERIKRAVESCGGICEMTPAECASGTDRIAWAARAWSEDVVLNLQGDEPLVDPSEIASLARHMVSHPDDEMATHAAPCSEEDLARPSVVKVVCDATGRALYFSRAPIPYVRNEEGAEPRRHVGIYAYRRSTLLALAELPPSALERREGLEQLRALENGIDIRVLPASGGGVGVDTPEDLERARLTIQGSEAAGAGRGGGGSKSRTRRQRWQRNTSS